MNKSECGKIIAILQTNDRKGVVTPATIESWAWVMDDIPFEAAKFAAEEWLRNHNWFPFPAEFREILANRLTGLPPVDEAWSVVMDRMRSTYPGQSSAPWTAPDAIQKTVKAMGGMGVLRMSSKPGLDALKFAEIYGRLRDRELREMDIRVAWELVGAQLTAGGSGRAAISEHGARA